MLNQTQLKIVSVVSVIILSYFAISSALDLFPDPKTDDEE